LAELVMVLMSSAAFASIAEHDPPAARFMHRAKELALSPLGPDWEAITSLEDK
jgi:hypothetical protein